ncbi:MAG: cytochrome C oxidase subunit IV family protein [Acidimicrobiia bacterium]
MTEESGEGIVATTEPEVERAIERPQEHLPEEHLPAEMTTSAPGLLPGELRPHPTPIQYVMVAVVLVVITAIEIAVSYTEGTIPDGLIVVLLLGMAFVKFFLVAAWYMHLRTDQPVFRRFFILGSAAAILLYLIVLATLHGIA